MDADITGPSIPRLLDAADEQAYATKTMKLFLLLLRKELRSCL